MAAGQVMIQTTGFAGINFQINTGGPLDGNATLQLAEFAFKHAEHASKRAKMEHIRAAMMFGMILGTALIVWLTGGYGVVRALINRH